MSIEQLVTEMRASDDYAGAFPAPASRGADAPARRGAPAQERGSNKSGGNKEVVIASSEDFFANVDGLANGSVKAVTPV